MKKYLLLLFVAGTTLTACTNHSHNDEPTAMAKQGDSLAVVQAVPSSPHEEAQTGSHHHEEDGAVVQLNNGSKWKANPETITGIHNMQRLVEEGISGKTTPGQLHGPLQSEFNTIFEKCTMKGEAHQQLHNYLLPFKEYLYQMEQGEDSPEHLKEMQAYLLSFNRFFE